MKSKKNCICKCTCGCPKTKKTGLPTKRTSGALSAIVAGAKELRKANPTMKWTEAIKASSIAYKNKAK